MQPENSFDMLSKRLAVAVSRRSLLRSFSVALAGAFLPWRTAFGQDNRPTSIDLETKFLAGPFVIDLPLAGKVEPRCIAAVAEKISGKPVSGTTSAGKEGECPSSIASYYENSDLVTVNARESTFDGAKAYNVRVVEGRSRLLYAHPAATSYSFVNPITGKEEFDAYCSTFTYLDPRVHKGDPDLKMIHYERKPIPKQLTSLNDPVTCGDINEAYENEIKTRKPIALRDFTVDAVPHQQSSKRVNATGTSTRDNSGHEIK